MLLSLSILLLALVKSENVRKLLQYDGSYNHWLGRVWDSGVQTLPTLPRGTFGSAIGNYNNTIYIVGGCNYEGQQLMSFDITSFGLGDYFSMFTDHGMYVLSNRICGIGGYYTQNEDILYMIDGLGDKFSIFNLKTKEFTYFWNNITFPVTVASQSCLAYSNNFLFIVGGLGGPKVNISLRSLQIFNISSNEWLTNVPEMIYWRAADSCIVHQDTNQLYGIGGYGAHNTMEKIFIGDNLNNISNEKWEYIGDLLVWNGSETVGSRSVIYGDDVVIMGGVKNGFYVDITVIDAPTNIIRSGGYLKFATAYAPAIIVNDIIYLFGGLSSHHDDKWQYKILTPTNEPTFDPTTDPTTDPTNDPTTEPTTDPTIDPTTDPTIDPTNDPTTDPTPHPTSHPTTDPTKGTTIDPTRGPSCGPTIDPTEDPTIDPTNDPTSYPTYHPTNYPAKPTMDPTNSPTNEGSDMVLMISLIAIGLFILLLIVCGAYRYSMKYVKKRNIELQLVPKSKLLYPL